MNQATDSAAGATNDRQERGGYVCPFCGVASESERPEGAACPRCGISDTPSTRKATKLRIGPWHIRQMKNPWAPGMRWETLLVLVRREQVTANTIVRGPTTHQLWRRAARVKGLSREFGLCYSCGEAIARDANLCPHCNRLQEPPTDPDVLVENRELVRDPRNNQSTAEPQPARETTGPMEAHSRREGMPVMRTAAQPEQGERPSRSLQRRRWSAEEEQGDALLSARDLAAAFKLDFAPREQKRWPVLRSLAKIFIVALLFGGTCALLYVKPELGISAWNWAQKEYHALREKGTKHRAPKPALKSADMSDDLASAPRPVVEYKPVAPLVPLPAPASAPVHPAAIVPAQPATRPAAVAARKVPPATTAPAVDPVDEARALWRQAIDAEGNKDFVEAVRCYEKIKKLPPDAQPAGVDVRLEMARKQLP